MSYSPNNPVIQIWKGLLDQNAVEPWAVIMMANKHRTALAFFPPSVEKDEMNKDIQAFIEELQNRQNKK